MKIPRNSRTTIFFALVASILPAMPISVRSGSSAPKQIEPQSHTNWPQYALTGAAGGALGFLGYKYFKHTKRKKDVQLSRLGQQVGKGVRKKITDYIIPEFEELAYEDRTKLLHLVIPFPIRIIKDALYEARRRASKIFIDYQTVPQEMRDDFEQPGPRAIFGCRIIPGHETLVHHYHNFFAEQQKNPDLIYIKNKTHPRVLLKVPLGVGEFGVVGFTDGDVQIFLHNADRRTINNFSYDQREFIKGIYYTNYQLHMTAEQTKIFDSLPTGIQERLKKNYEIHRYSIYSTLPKMPFNLPSFSPPSIDLDNIFQKSKPFLGLAATAASIVRIGHVKSDDQKVARAGWLGFTLLFWLMAFADKKADDIAWIVPIGGLGLFESALGCYRLGEYLSKKS